MPIKPPLIDLPIRVSQSGFYQGFTKDVAITAKILVGALILWAIAFPDQAASVLGQMNSFILAGFNYWYVYVMAFFSSCALGWRCGRGRASFAWDMMMTDPSFQISRGFR